jgi:hypothetical protein
MLPDKLIDDAQSCPIEISVTVEFGARLSELREQEMGGGCWLSIGTHERSAVRSDLPRCGTDNAGVLANENYFHLGIERCEAAATSKLTIREKHRLALLAVKIEKRRQA